MKFVGLVKPHMAINARALVEPSFLKGGVCAHAYDVLTAVVEVLRDVIDLRRIAAWLMSEVKAVHPYACVAEYAVELQPQVLPIVLCWNCEGLSVPAHTGFGVLVSYGLVSMAVACLSCVRKVHDPVVRQVYDGPSRSVKLRGVWTLVVDGSCLGQVVEILGSAAEVLCR